jgi:uridine kinase
MDVCKIAPGIYPIHKQFIEPTRSNADLNIPHGPNVLTTYAIANKR